MQPTSEYIRAMRLKSWQMIHEVSGFVVSERLRQLNAMLTKYSPTQPRVPAGNPDGGQWTSVGGGGGGIVPERRPGTPMGGIVPQRPGSGVRTPGTIPRFDHDAGRAIEEFPRPRSGGIGTPPIVPGRTPASAPQVSPQAALDAAIGNVVGRVVGVVGDAVGSVVGGIQDAFSGFDQFPVADGAGQLPNQVNIFIGGADDEGGLLGGNHPVRNSRALSRDVSGYNIYATYKDADEINASIQKLPLDIPINVIGHSLGGATATEVALANPGRINKLITVDPVGPIYVGRDPKIGVPVYDFPDYGKVNSSVGKWVNIRATGQPGNDDSSNAIARMGGRWKDSPRGYADVFIPAPYNHGDFDNLLRSIPPVKSHAQ
jgi:hypothetical protein